MEYNCLLNCTVEYAVYFGGARKGTSLYIRKETILYQFSHLNIIKSIEFK